MATSDGPLSTPNVSVGVERRGTPVVGPVVDNDDGTIMITGAGFGKIAPIFCCNLDAANASSADSYSSLDTLLGPGSTIDSPDGLPAEVEPKLIGGMGMVIGSADLELNGGATATLNVDHPNSRRVFQSRTQYMRRAHSELIVDYRTGVLPDPATGGSSSNTGWQIKTLWEWTNREDGGGDTDFYVTLLERWFSVAGGPSTLVNLTSNTIGGSTGTLTDTNVASTTYNGYKIPLDEPYTIEHAYDQGLLQTSLDRGTMWAQVYCPDAGVQSEKQTFDMNLVLDSGPVKEINGFGYPGFIRGFPREYNCHFLETQVFRQIGPGAWCRAAICNNADYFASTKRVLLPPQDGGWNDKQIIANLPLWAPTLAEWSGWYLCVVDINNNQIDTGRLL